MIQLTRLNHALLTVNSDLIEHLEATPDTVITLTTGQRFLVLESSEDVVQKVIEFRRTIAAGAGCFRTVCPASRLTEETVGTGAGEHGR